MSNPTLPCLFTVLLELECKDLECIKTLKGSTSAAATSVSIQVLVKFFLNNQVSHKSN